MTSGDRGALFLIGLFGLCVVIAATNYAAYSAGYLNGTWDELCFHATELPNGQALKKQCDLDGRPRGYVP